MINYRFFILLLFGFSACNLSSSKLATPTPALPEILSNAQVLEKVRPSNVPFQLYRLQATSPQNINISPLSLKLAFAMVYAGASGKTEKMLTDLFGFSAVEKMPGAKEYELADQLAAQKDATTQLEIANSAWFKDVKSINPEFKNAMKELHAESYKINTKEINSWVSDHTRGKITKLFDQVDPETLAIFVNTIYFKAPWLHPFEKKNTGLAVFTSSKYLTLKIPTMHAQNRVQYYEDESSQWVELPYRDSDFVMRLVLPRKKFDLRKVEEQLSEEYLIKVASKQSEALVTLLIPKFKFNQQVSFKNLFTSAGYGDLFAARPGDFSKISKSSEFKIADVIQATAIVVDEVGTEAAAVTSAVMESTSLSLNIPKVFNADQPFLFVLQNKKTSEIYFMGRVTDPSSL